MLRSRSALDWTSKLPGQFVAELIPIVRGAPLGVSTGRSILRSGARLVGGGKPVPTTLSCWDELAKVVMSVACGTCSFHARLFRMQRSRRHRQVGLCCVVRLRLRHEPNRIDVPGVAVLCSANGHVDVHVLQLF